jgi:type II secretory pathway pseudopilin PulG
MKKGFFVIIASLIFFQAFATESDSLLQVLDREMAKRVAYDNAKKAHIKQLEHYLADKTLSLTERYGFNSSLIAEFIPYQFASAVKQLQSNIDISQKTGDIKQLYQAKLQLANLLSSSGNYAEAGEVLRGVKRTLVPDELLNFYYYCQVWQNYRLKFYSAYTPTQQVFNTRYRAYADTLQTRLKPGTEEYLNLSEAVYRDEGSYLKSRDANIKRLALAVQGTRIYGSITFFLAQSYLPENNIEQYKKYLALSAISDIRASIKDNAALTALAVQFFKEGDIQRAHRYINFAFDDALFYNSRLRLQSISSILPLINQAYDDAAQKQKDKLQVTVIIISILSVVLLVLVFFVLKQLKNLKRARKNLQAANEKLNELNASLQTANGTLQGLYDELADTNRVKEYYIGTLLNLCSDYLDKLDAYRKTVKKMIVARQVNELLDKTKSAEFIEEEVAQFYKNFDTIFLHIYPHFVDDVNALLLPDEKIVLKNGELLNTELRIFALVRLGINDSASIARLLRYSVNTIYNYRVRIKNKAIDRDDFENGLMKIGSFQKLPEVNL